MLERLILFSIVFVARVDVDEIGVEIELVIVFDNILVNSQVAVGGVVLLEYSLFFSDNLVEVDSERVDVERRFPFAAWRHRGIVALEIDLRGSFWVKLATVWVSEIGTVIRPLFFSTTKYSIFLP